MQTIFVASAPTSAPMSAMLCTFQRKNDVSSRCATYAWTIVDHPTCRAFKVLAETRDRRRKDETRCKISLFAFEHLDVACQTDETMQGR